MAKMVIMRNYDDIQRIYERCTKYIIIKKYKVEFFITFVCFFFLFIYLFGKRCTKQSTQDLFRYFVTNFHLCCSSKEKRLKEEASNKKREKKMCPINFE